MEPNTITYLPGSRTLMTKFGSHRIQTLAEGSMVKIVSSLSAAYGEFAMILQILPQLPGECDKLKIETGYQALKGEWKCSRPRYATVRADQVQPATLPQVEETKE